MILNLPADPTRIVLFVALFIVLEHKISAQSGTEFWLAPPEITDLHHVPGGEPLYLFVSSTGAASTVTVEQPANAGFVPIVVNVAADKTVRIDLTPFKSQLETGPTDTVLNTGLHITSTTTITCYYECANTNNTDIWALKGPNAEGTEFYIPLTKHDPFFNHAAFAAPHQAYASFDICATEDNTVVTIYSPTPVDGHPALQQFSVNLNRGQTYSCGWTGTNWEQPSTHPGGAIVLANYPITVSLKDDSDHNPSGGCYDIIGDQIVPVDVVGEDYIAVKGSLNATGDESIVLMATQNNTQVFVDGSASPVATLFAGEYFRVDMDNVTSAMYVHCTKPTYAMHITGFGCELGMAQLPPLNCAGSQQLNFVRDDAQTFYLTILCRTPAIGGFTVTGSGTASIPAASFATVPGTGGEWQAAKITYDLTQVPVDSTFKVSNSIDVFALGVVNGGATTGCKYGYFSEYVAPIVANAGVDQTICANTTTSLSGSVAGGTITGIWTSTGTGSFTPDNTTLNAVYTPSAADAAVGSVLLKLTSTGACIPVEDEMTLTITPAPTSTAGVDQSVCSNNANTSLNGSVTIATGGVWTGGAGTFIPGNNVLNPVYVPTASEISSGSVALTLTTTGNGICNPVSDNLVITFTASPVVNAGADQTKCGNNAATTLAGSITVATGGVWTGGGGSFVPSNTSLNPVYTPSAAEIASGSVTLTLTSTGNSSCNAVIDQMTIFFSAPPTISAGADQTKCANNAATTLAGSVTGATGGQWSGGLGVFSPNNNIATATYTPTAGEIAAESMVLTFSSTGNGTCNPVADQMTIFFTGAPTVNAGPNQTTCANIPTANLNGSFTIASGALWTGGTGTFAPGNTSMNAAYTPSASEIAAGSVSLTLTTTGNGTCNQVEDQVLITITPSPTVNAGPDQTRCGNNAAATLAGNITTATGGTWTGGAGTFNPSSSSLNAVYTPTASEISSGSVTLTLISTGNGSCSIVSDQVTIFFSSSPTANAGADQILCANNAVATLAGNVTVSGGGQWSGGLGIFLPNSNSLNATYTPTVGEISSGGITLTLTTTSNGSCNAATDQVTISFTSAPTVNAGSDQTVCGNNAITTLSGSFTTATGAIWSGGSGSFIPNNTSMNVTYTPTASEITNGSVTLNLTSTGNGTCATVSDQVLITITPAPVVNAGTDQVRCANNAAASLAGSISVATGGSWTGGAGTFNPSSSSLNAVYTPTASEITNGSITLTLTSAGNGICNAESDQVTIFYSSPPTVLAGIDQTLCGNNAVTTLSGIVTTASGGQWSGGLGIFSPNNNTLNATYAPTASEIAGGNVTLTLTTTGNGGCNAVSDALTLFFTPSPTINAGSALTSCANNAAVTLNGSYTIATGAVWSGGNGTYAPGNNSMNAVYSPSGSEITAGGLTLTLTSTGNGTCIPVSDQVSITISPAPLVNAGSDHVTCINNLNVGLSGSVAGTTNTGVWSTSGTGTFVPNNTTLNATYQSSAADVSAGSVTITLTSTGNGSCNAVTDQCTITILPPGTAIAGSDATVCGNNATIILNGVVGGGASSGIWGTTGTGSFVPNNSSLNTTYHPSSFDILNGGVTLFLTANSCNVAADSLDVTITSTPVVYSGEDQVICSSAISATLNGNVSGGSTSGFWTTSGSGTFSPSNSALNASYIHSASDISAQDIYLILTSADNGQCLPVADTLVLHIYPSGTSSAGADQILCANNAEVSLSGSLEGGATQGQWSTSGSGVFVPSNTSLDAVYEPSSADIANGNVTISLTATNSCNAATDNLNVTFAPAPTVDAGEAITSCANNASVILDGDFAVATGAIWTGGNGSFSPGNATMNAAYTPTQEEISNGSVTLMLTTDGNGTCLAVSDAVVITIVPSPVVNAGVDQQTCVNDLNVALNGSVQGITMSGQWTTSGSGTFSPSNTALNAVYQLSEQDSIAGSITLTLTSTNNASCLAVSDVMSVSIVPASVTTAGDDVVVCANNATVSLNGTVSGGASTGIWSTTGTGTFFPNNTALNAVYIPSDYDKANGGATIYLTASTCVSSSDSLDVVITPAPFVDAGIDQTICASASEVELNGMVTGGSSTGIWTTSGSGIFSPSSATLNATYIASEADVLAQNIALILTSLDNGSCFPESDTLVLNIYPIGTSTAGTDHVVCGNNPNVTLEGTLGGGATLGAWNSTGSGVFIPNHTTLNATYVPSQNDIVAGGVILGLTATNSCNNAIDFLSISFTLAPVVDAGLSQSVCGDSPEFILGGNISNATGGTWSGGDGTFTPDNSVLNATYTASAEEAAQGFAVLTLTSSGNGNCNAVSDTLSLYITNGIIANAGVDQEVCISAPYTQLQGSIANGAATGSWSTLGSGTFSPDQNALNALYYFSPADIVSDSISLVLTSTDNGNCPAARDTVHITFGQSAFVNAGNDQSICSSTLQIPLNGFITGGATEGIWTTSGNGTFSPDNISTVAEYTITPSDIAAGEVSFILTTTDNGSCLPGIDTLIYMIDPLPIVNAGGDVTICSDNLSVPLAGNVSATAGGGAWSTMGAGIFDPDNTTLNATYIPGASDSLVGGVTLVLTSTSAGTCLSVSDTMLITITSPSIVNAGSDVSMCSVDAIVNLNGSVTGGSITGTWSSSGSGTFNPDNSTLNGTYTPSSSDLANGSISLTLTSTGNGICAAATDVMNVNFEQPALVNAGPDWVLCGANTEVGLNGIVSGSATTGIWTTDGSGTFDAASNVLNNTYTLSTADVIDSEVMIILTSTNNSLCAAVSDTMYITVEPLPVAAFSAASGDELDVQFTDESIGAASWFWDFGVGGSSTTQDPFIIYPDTGSYVVTLIIYSNAGCSDTISTTVQALESIGTPVAIPSGFSPNGDNSNDVLYVLGGPFEAVDFRIYNEWGNLVFSTTDPNIGWDGTYKNKEQPGGVYVYTAEGVTVKGRYVRLSGNVTLIR